MDDVRGETSQDNGSEGTGTGASSSASQETAAREPKTYQEISQMIDLHLLDPLIPEEQVAAMCERARRYGIASVVVRPSDAQLAAQWLSGMTCGSSIGGDHTTTVKLYEVRDLLGRGVREFTAAINVGKLVSRQFQYIEMELLQMQQQCKEMGARLKVTLELETLPPDLRVIGCKILKRAEVDYCRASSRIAASTEDIAFLKSRLGNVVRLDAGGDVRTLDEAKRVFRDGCERFSSRNPWLMLEAWKTEIAAREKAEKEAASQVRTIPAT
jgi:deoxyribose-phosphate aldolase